MAQAFVSKPGRHGTLYRFRIRYTDVADPCCMPDDWYVWAYNAEHAEQKFFDSDDDGWKILGIERVREIG